MITAYFINGVAWLEARTSIMAIRPPNNSRCTRFGTFSYAYRCGRCGHPDSSIVLASSRICVGLGVFARRDIPAGSVVTFYDGHLTQENADDDYAFEMPSCFAPRGETGWQVVGHRGDDRSLRGKGLAQMVNDAIHPEATRRGNNCHFVFRWDSEHGQTVRIYLQTMRSVPAGRELLAPYGLNYWVARASRFVHRITGRTTRLGEWLKCHEYVISKMKRRGWEVEDYKGIVTTANAVEGGTSGQGDVGEARYLVTPRRPSLFLFCRCGDGRRRSCRHIWMTVVMERRASVGPPSSYFPALKLRCDACRSMTPL